MLIMRLPCGRAVPGGATGSLTPKSSVRSMKTSHSPRNSTGGAGSSSNGSHSGGSHTSKESAATM